MSSIQAQGQTGDVVDWNDIYLFLRNEFTKFSWRLGQVKDRFVNERPFSAFEELNKLREEYEDFLDKDRKALWEEFSFYVEMQKEIKLRQAKRQEEFQMPASER